MAAPFSESDSLCRLKSVREFSAHIHQELIRSTSDEYSVFHIILRKAFVLHQFLKKGEMFFLISTVFDCMFGCGSGPVTIGFYKKFKPFGPTLCIPAMAIVTFILGLNGFIYGGIWNKLFQALITIVFMTGAEIEIQDFFMFAAIFDNSVRCTSVLSNEERCVKCHKLFLQPLLLSTKICICVCQNCHRKSDECTKCRSSPYTGN